MKMQKKGVKAAAVLLGVLVGAAGFAGCEMGDGREYKAHVWAQEWETVVAPTCTEAGEAQRFCLECNEYKTKTVAPLGHDLEIYDAKAATCTQKGWEAYEICMRAGCGYTTYQEIGNLMHEYENGACLRCDVLEPSAGLVYERNEDGYAVTGIGACGETSIVIASKYQGLAVTEIAPSAFEGCEQLTQVHISENIHTIGENSFKNCRNLLEINIPSSVKKIGLNAFQSCFDLDILEVEDVGAWCEVTFENSQNSLYCYANPLYYARGFYTDGALVKKLVVPDTVKTINALAFYHCDALTSANISGKVETIGERAFYDCKNLASVSFGNGLKRLDKQAFYACKKLKSLVLPDSVEDIGDYAFYNCKDLTSVTLGAGLTALGKSAFQNCSALIFNEYGGGRYLGTAKNPYFALVEITVLDRTEFTLHADTKVVFDGADLEKEES